MNKLSQLRERRNAKAKAAHDLNAKFPADQRMPAADAATLDALLGEVGDIDAEIVREQRVLAIELEQNPQAAADALRDKMTRDPHGREQNPETVALRAFLTGGVAALTEEQRSAMRARQNQDIRAAMSTTTNSEGGYTVATEYYKALEIALKMYGGIRDLATVIRTGTGATLNFPTADPTAEVGEIVGQNSAVSGADTTFGNLALDVYKYSSKIIALPFELHAGLVHRHRVVHRAASSPMRLGRIQNRTSPPAPARANRTAS
jgi:HK97 family phage major capsid protein